MDCCLNQGKYIRKSDSTTSTHQIPNSAFFYFTRITISILIAFGTITTPQNPQSSNFGYYFQKHATAAPPSYLTNTHTQKPILTCDQPGHPSCYSIGYSKGLLNTRLSCDATTLNSFVVANPSQVNNFCSGYRVAAQQILQQHR
jgi:hypothetical protein